MIIYYDITRFPDLTAHGLLPLNMLYAPDFWGQAAWDDQAPSIFQKPTLAAIKQAARSARVKDLPVCLDIEHIDRGVLENLKIYAYILTEMKREEPNLNIGYFGKAPDGSWPLAVAPPEEDLHQTWLDWNAQQAYLAYLSDTIYPCVYAPYADNDIYRIIINRQYYAAIKYGRPVRWVFRPRAVTTNTLLSDANLRFALNCIRSCDGSMLLWQMYQFKASFTGEEEWFNILKQHV